MTAISGSTAAITGAGSGIGRATALALARRGARLALADVNEAGLAETARLARSHLGDDEHVSTHLCDVSHREDIERYAADAAKHHGAIHLLVNNAGVTSAGRFEDEPIDDLEWIVSINVWGVVHGCRTFLPHIRAAGRGHIVNLSSMAGLLGLPRNVIYSMSKGAVRTFSEGLRAELRSSGIGVTMVHPGAINTNIAKAARGAEAERLQRLGALQDGVLGRIVMRPPEAVAKAIVRGIEHDRARVLVGPDARLVDAWARLVPSRSGLIGRAIDRIS